ncbi:hypothetical protein AWC38_SpisGene23247 [Stylophora pistillata]|uniref:Ubiquitin-like protease family profile domain-containing protein n=1 Tax=Stylophora pistillata TaxID=50429 RepID=A0A2B4R8Z0_STYPI|nr:hypothetical protein AWC38_SpisGene23247 [Stylophora pistillata]
MDISEESDPKSHDEVPVTSSYAENLESHFQERYLKKICVVGLDPAAILSEQFSSECLPPMEVSDLLFYLVLETSYYANKQSKAFKSLEACNQMVYGFFASVQGKEIAGKIVVVAKVRHSQRMKDPLVNVWIIAQNDGAIISAHCLGCKAGLAESCSHVARVMFYIEAVTRIQGNLACTQAKCTWSLPTYVNDVPYAKAKPTPTDKLVECHGESCKNGKYFYLACLDLKRMPNNHRTTWKCAACKRVSPAQATNTSTTCSSSSDSSSSEDESDVVITKVTQGETDKTSALANLTDHHFHLIINPTGWLDCDIIQRAHVLLHLENPAIAGFHKPTLGPVRNFVLVSGELVQILHAGNNHWVCVSSIGCVPGYVNLFDSLYHDSVIIQEVEEQTNDLLGGRLIALDPKPVQQQTNGSDCGVFAVAFATSLVFGVDPTFIYFDTQGYLVLLSGDVSLNPGPVNGLDDVVKLRGLKFIHQNIQSLGDKIDQLRLLLQELQSGIQIITLSETWIKADRSDSEYEIPGYKLFRKDRKGNHGGVAVFVHDELVATRRDDLELDTVEGMWLEIAVPKSRSFLVGNFYRPDRTSRYYDKDFMLKLNGILDTASAEGKEMLLFGLPLITHSFLRLKGLP